MLLKPESHFYGKIQRKVSRLRINFMVDTSSTPGADAEDSVPNGKRLLLPQVVRMMFMETLSIFPQK